MEQRLILFGDSITAGYLAGEITDLLTRPVAAAFPAWQVINAGIPGDTAQSALLRLEAHVLKYEPTLVTVCFGANDVADASISPADFTAALTTIIERLGAERVILCSLPFSQASFYEGSRALPNLHAYAELARAVAQRHDVFFVDTLAFMLEREEPGALLQADGLHFSQAGYDFLSELLVAAVSQKLIEMSDHND